MEKGDPNHRELPLLTNDSSVFFKEDEQLNTVINRLPQSCSENDESSHCDHCDHCHGHIPKTKWKLIAMIILNAVTMLVELVAGIMTKSLSLQSDAFHMLTDEFSLIIGLVANNLSIKPPGDTMTFGWTRMEPFGGLCNGAFLLAVCISIFCSAMQRFIHVPEIDKPLLFIIVGSVGFVINLSGIFIFHDHHHSDNLKGVFLHILGDFFGSVGVMISACVINFTNWKYKYYVDPVISLIIVAILSTGAIPLLKRTGKIVLEKVPENVSLSQIRRDLSTIPQVIAFHDLHVWELSKKLNYGSVHIVVNGNTAHNHSIIKLVNDIMRKNKVKLTTIQVEYVDNFPKETKSDTSCLYSSSLSMQNRCFDSLPIYKHCVGCPHINKDGSGLKKWQYE